MLHKLRLNPQSKAIDQGADSNAKPWLKLNCSLGEGPFYEEKTNTLRFLDVEKCRLHHVDLNVGPSSHKVIKELDISIGYEGSCALAPRAIR